ERTGSAPGGAQPSRRLPVAQRRAGSGRRARGAARGVGVPLPGRLDGGGPGVVPQGRRRRPGGPRLGRGESGVAGRRLRRPRGARARAGPAVGRLEPAGAPRQRDVRDRAGRPAAPCGVAGARQARGDPARGGPRARARGAPDQAL
ncbi:MAG: hypothetical protein AVDCRST_MAG34-894, partial [uncultured Nocardioidaceae bacterium]